MSVVVEGVETSDLEVEATRRRFKESEAVSCVSVVVDPLFRELSEVRDGDAAPSDSASKIRSNLRFFVSIA